MLSVPRRSSRPRVSYSPGGFKRARQQYDAGNLSPLIRLMQGAAEDSHVAGCLMGRRSGYMRPWALVSPDDDDVAVERRDWLTGVLQRLEIRGLTEAIHDGRLYGYSVIDFDWSVEDGRQVPTAWEHFDPHHFRYDDDGELRLIRGNKLEQLTPTCLVVVPRRHPAMAPATRDYILKDYGVEAFASFLENFGEPFIMAKYPPGADDAFKAEVQKALDEIASSARGMAPEGTSIEVHQSTNYTGAHDTFIDRAEKGISISLLGHANAVEQGSGLQIGDHPSSYEVRHDLAVDDMHFIDAALSRFVAEVYRRNFADGRPPLFALHKQRPVDGKQHTDIVRTWYGMGLTIHPDEARKVGLYVDADQPPLLRDPNSPPLI